MGGGECFYQGDIARAIANFAADVNLADYGMNPQAALDAPRWQFIAGNQVLLEPTVPSHIALALAQRGHHIEMSTDRKRFGKGQMILQQGGVFVAASEPRGDGLALAY